MKLGKKEFFEMYQSYKDEKINLDNLLVFDWIQLQMMMDKEIEILEREIKAVENEVDEQEVLISSLENEKMSYIEKK